MFNLGYGTVTTSSPYQPMYSPTTFTSPTPTMYNLPDGGDPGDPWDPGGPEPGGDRPGGIWGDDQWIDAGEQNPWNPPSDPVPQPTNPDPWPQPNPTYQPSFGSLTYGGPTPIPPDGGGGWQSPGAGGPTSLAPNPAQYTDPNAKWSTFGSPVPLPTSQSPMWQPGG